MNAQSVTMTHDELWSLLSIAMFGVGVFTGACAHRGYLDYRQLFHEWHHRRVRSSDTPEVSASTEPNIGETNV